MRGSKAPPLELYLLYERRRLKITDYIRLLWLFRFHFFVCRHLRRLSHTLHNEISKMSEWYCNKYHY